MSEYNFYAKHLDEAFKKARTDYTDAYNKMEKARKNYDDSKKWRKESFEGENDQRRRRAELTFLQAQDEFKKVESEAWAQFDHEAQDLTQRLKKTLAEDGIADSDKLDPAAMQLLQSGIMNTSDYENMVSKFDGNSTMTRLTSKYIREYADSIKDNSRLEERGRLYQLAEATSQGASKKERDWDGLLNIAKIYSGRHNSDRPEPGFAVRMANRWDDESPQTAISNF